MDGDTHLDALFANSLFEPNRVCLGDGTGLANSFTCSDVSADVPRSGGVALSVCADGSTPPCIANQPPVADAGLDQTVECNSTNETSVLLDGTGSTDPDGDPLTYAWTGPFGTTNGPTAIVTLPLGTHLITLTVDDGQGGIDSDTLTVVVEDTTPPSINSLTATPSTLSPPNHKMVPVSVAVAVSDACDAAPTCQIIAVSSNEPVGGQGRGDRAPDWEITGDFTVNLRAERAGGGSGRVYTITLECSDASGNTSTGTVNVTVPRG